MSLTLEELDIIVDVSIEKALNEFDKLVPSIQKAGRQVREEINRINANGMVEQVKNAVKNAKKSLQSVKKENVKNDIQVNVNAEKTQKQITQLEKEIDSLQKKISASQMKLDINSGALDKILSSTAESIQAKNPGLSGNKLNDRVDYELSKNDTHNTLSLQNMKLDAGIEKMKMQLESAKQQLEQLLTEEGQEPTSGQLNFWESVKLKITEIKQQIKDAHWEDPFDEGEVQNKINLVDIQIKTLEDRIKQFDNGKIELNDEELYKIETKLDQLYAKKEKLENSNKGKGGLLSGLKEALSSAGNILSSLTGKIGGIFKCIKQKASITGNTFKLGIGQIMKYATALFGLRTIYSTLQQSASSWLSSQNSGAQQLSANIEYMKYAMGSVFAPVIENAINLVYQLIKAIQSVVYAMSGINIFAKATASSMNKTAGSAKQTSKSLAGVHSEINNVSDNNNSGGGGGTTPSFDLSQMDNTPNSIIDAIKNGDWYEVGATIGRKLNEAMANIPWEQIQNTAKSIGTNIAKFLNGFIATTDWHQVGNTLAQGLNTVIYFAYSFITTFDWKQYGKAIGDGINGFIKNVDWATFGKTIGGYFKGAFDTISTTLQEIDWQQVAVAVEEFITNVDWSGITEAFFSGVGAALGGLSAFLGKIIYDAFIGIGQYFDKKVEECGGNIVLGILKGIGDAVIGIGQWIKDHIFTPFIDGFKNAFGIHSPSTVMQEMGQYIIEGLFNGLKGIWNTVKSIFEGLKTNIVNKFNETKTNLGNWANNTKETIKNWADNAKSKIVDTWSNISNNVKSKINDVKSNISTGLNNAKSTISSWANDAKTTFSNLGNDAKTWGKDLIDNMASGIKNNISKVSGAVSSVASKIKGLLGFSEPEEGPLSNFHTYMPDMIDLMVQGIRSNMGKVTTELEELAGTMSYTINTPELNSIPYATGNIPKPQNVMRETFADVLSDFEWSNSNNDRPINLAIYVGNKKLGEIMLDDLRDKKRQTGKDLEALVGG